MHPRPWGSKAPSSPKITPEQKGSGLHDLGLQAFAIRLQMHGDMMREVPRRVGDEEGDARRDYAEWDRGQERDPERVGPRVLGRERCRGHHGRRRSGDKLGGRPLGQGCDQLGDLVGGKAEWEDGFRDVLGQDFGGLAADDDVQHRASDRAAEEAEGADRAVGHAEVALGDVEGDRGVASDCDPGEGHGGQELECQTHRGGVGGDER